MAELPKGLHANKAIFEVSDSQNQTIPVVSTFLPLFPKDQKKKPPKKFDFKDTKAKRTVRGCLKNRIFDQFCYHLTVVRLKSQAEVSTDLTVTAFTAG